LCLSGTKATAPFLQILAKHQKPPTISMTSTRTVYDNGGWKRSLPVEKKQHTYQTEFFLFVVKDYYPILWLGNVYFLIMRRLKGIQPSQNNRGKHHNKQQYRNDPSPIFFIHLRENNQRSSKKNMPLPSKSSATNSFTPQGFSSIAPFG